MDFFNIDGYFISGSDIDHTLECPSFAGFHTPAEPSHAANVRFGSLADILRPPSECPLSGVERTLH